MIFASSSLAGSADLVDVFLRLRGNGQISWLPWWGKDRAGALRVTLDGGCVRIVSARPSR
jgi:hypothetical protein